MKAASLKQRQRLRLKRRLHCKERFLRERAAAFGLRLIRVEGGGGFAEHERVFRLEISGSEIALRKRANINECEQEIEQLAARAAEGGGDVG